jgi:hypothetical protein
MPNLFIVLRVTILRWCGLSAPVPTSSKPTKSRPKNRAGSPKTTQQSRVRLSPVAGPSLALRVIADSVGQIAGFPCQPREHHDLEVAWLQLGDPVAGLVQSLIALGETIPQFLASKDENAQFARLVTTARRSPTTYIKAIWREAPVRAALQATSFLADQVQRLFQGRLPQPTRTNGVAGEREWHVVDSMDRPVVCRLLRHDDGRLEILDGRASHYLHPDTLRLSCWRLSEGWLLAPGFRNRGRNDGGGDGLPNPELRPDPTQPKI